MAKTPKNPRIAGLDLSLTGTGVAVIDAGWGGDPKRVQSWRVSAPEHVGASDVARVARCMAIASNVCALLREHDVAHVFIERYAFGMAQQATRAFALGELGGIVRMLVKIRCGLDTTSVSVGSVRKVLLGDGRAKKADVIAALARIGWDRSHDEGDALAVANYGLSELGQPAVTLR